jgi:hypothetical protein
MKILSWDVGIYNLSYCILEKNKDDDIKIIGWDIINLVDNESMKKNINLLFENIPKKLYEIPELLNVDIVIIENQPSLKNPKMKSIQMILYSYFIILGKIIGNGDKTTSYIDKIDFCSASNKLKVYDGPEINIISKNKNLKKKSELEPISEIKIETELEIKLETELETKKKKKTITYSDKKKLAILHAQYYLQYQDSKYLEFFNLHKKKDDLSDSFLQGLYWYKYVKK